MAAPSFSGVTHYTGSYSFALAASGSAVYPSSSGVNFNALTNSAGFVDMRGATGVTGGFGLLSAIDSTTFSSMSLSSVKAFCAFMFIQNGNNFNGSAQDLQIGFADSSNVYNVWYLGDETLWNGAAFRYFSFPIILQPGMGVDASNGTINLANVNKVIAAYEVGGSNNSGPRPQFTFATIGADGIVLTGGEVANAHSFGALRELLVASDVATEIFLNHVIENTTPNSAESTGQFICLAPLTVRAARFESRGESVFCLNGTQSIQINDDYYKLTIEPQNSTDYHLFDNGSFSNGTAQCDIEVSASAHASATILFQDFSFAGSGSFTLRSPAIYTGGLCSKDEFIYRSGSATGHTLSSSTDCVIHCTPGQNLSALNLILSGANPVLRLNPGSAGAAAIDLSGLEASGEIDVQNDTANAITITLATGTNFTTANNTGGTVTVQVPQPTLTLVGLVAGSRIYIFNTTDSEVLYNVIEPTTEFSEDVPAGKSLLIRVRNASGTPKYKTFETTTTSPNNDFSITVNQELDE